MFLYDIYARVCFHKTNELSRKASLENKLVRKYRTSALSMKKSIYLQANVQCSFYYINILMATFLMIFRRFPTTFRRFPKIFKIARKAIRTFPNIFRKCPKMFEDFRGLPKIFEDDPKMFRWYTSESKYNLRDKLDGSEIIDIFTCEDIISSHAWGYRIVFINFLPLAIPLTFI